MLGHSMEVVRELPFLNTSQVILACAKAQRVSGDRPCSTYVQHLLQSLAYWHDPSSVFKGAFAECLGAYACTKRVRQFWLKASCISVRSRVHLCLITVDAWSRFVLSAGVFQPMPISYPKEPGSSLMNTPKGAQFGTGRIRHRSQSPQQPPSCRASGLPSL